MSEKKTQQSQIPASSPASRGTLQARHGSAFFDCVEREVEVVDVADLAQFMAADALPIEPDPGFREQLRGYLRGLVRSRFSH